MQCHFHSCATSYKFRTHNYFNRVIGVLCNFDFDYIHATGNYPLVLQCRKPQTYGVVPFAAIPITTSFFDTWLLKILHPPSVIFCVFNSETKGLVSSRHQSNYHFCGNAIGRWTFTRIQHTQAATGSCAKVKYPATSFKLTTALTSDSI